MRWDLWANVAGCCRLSVGGHPDEHLVRRSEKKLSKRRLCPIEGSPLPIHHHIIVSTITSSTSLFSELVSSSRRSLRRPSVRSSAPLGRLLHALKTDLPPSQVAVSYCVAMARQALEASACI